ncbi:hypothetical protein CEXT_609531 [Caerostris extrusa]|uniref:Uncharacterized protein n=1 Tax=Caerostris extrusa TaxID=172846 RepID=A0AAV4SVT8_CAEEX|nr:hypothetical protein CEXT_609531 [Caerostris extrusa]
MLAKRFREIVDLLQMPPIIIFNLPLNRCPLLPLAPVWLSSQLGVSGFRSCSTEGDIRLGSLKHRWIHNSLTFNCRLLALKTVRPNVVVVVVSLMGGWVQLLF